MPFSNVLTVPRGLVLFPKKWVWATCTAAELVGDSVYFSDDYSAGTYQVRTADPRDLLKIPAFGIITLKTSPTTCRVQWIGEVKDTYTGLTRNKTLFVGPDGRLSETPPTPLVAGYAMVQSMGVAMSSDIVLLVPSFSMTKRTG